MASVDSSDFHRELDWDPRLTSQNLTSRRLPDGVDREQVMECVRRMEKGLRELPVQLSHADINEYLYMKRPHQEILVPDWLITSHVT